MLNLFHIFIIVFMFMFYFIFKHDVKEKTTKEKILSRRNSINKHLPDKKTQVNLIRRKELSKILDSNFTKLDKKILLERFNHKCYKCGSSEKLEIDHHVPLTIGYPLKENSEYNAVILCRTCNRLKADSLPQEFYTSNELKSLESNYSVSSHLNIDSTRIAKINQLLISEKIKLLKAAIAEKKSISFDYIEMGSYNIFHERLSINAKPIEAFENMEFGVKKNKKIYVLKAEELESHTVKEFNLSFILDLKIG